MIKCDQCNGDGVVTNDDQKLPWTVYQGRSVDLKTETPVGPLICPKCNGSTVITEDLGAVDTDSIPKEVNKENCYKQFINIMKSEEAFYIALRAKTGKENDLLKYVANDKVRTTYLLGIITQREMLQMGNWVRTW